MDAKQNLELKIIAAKVRQGIIESLYNAKSGHPGGSLSAADIITYLYFKVLNVNPLNPKDPKRDRFVLSKGHAAPALYSVLAQKRFFPAEDLKTLRKVGSHLQGHPKMDLTPGIDMSTGSLGQGISAAVGMALSAKMFNDEYKVFSILGDGELQEGQVWEAAMFAGHKKLDNLIAFIDNNNLQIDGFVDEINSVYPIKEKFEAFGFEVFEIDGHDFNQIEDAVNKALNVKNKPIAIIAKTIKGKGISFMENECSWHGVAPNKEQYESAMQELETLLKSLEEGN